MDPGCGATYRDAALALNGLGCKTTTINAQPDGHFPARSSEPTEKSLGDLAKTVQALDADLGVAFDGDGDRVAFVDGKANLWILIELWQLSGLCPQETQAEEPL